MCGRFCQLSFICANSGFLFRAPLLGCCWAPPLLHSGLSDGNYGEERVWVFGVARPEPSEGLVEEGDGRQAVTSLPANLVPSFLLDGQLTAN